MFASYFETHANRPCLRARGPEGESCLTYAETLAHGRKLTADLAPRSLVALKCALTIDAVAAYAALMVDDHVPLLLEADLAPDLAEGLIAAYRPHAVLDPESGIIARHEGPELHPDLGLLLTTSGSTGSPKLVRHRASGLAANADSIAEYLGLGPDERPLLHLPMSYSYGMSVLNSHFAVGACICLTRHTVMEPGYWQDMADFEATSLSGVAFHYQALRRFVGKQLELPHLKSLTQAGGRLDPKFVKFFADWAGKTGRKFHVMYGQTEAGPRIAHLPPDQAANAPEAIGLAIPGVRIELRGDDGKAVADGETGELVVESPAVMMGYALTADDLARGDELGGILQTGDLAQKGADGLLRIVGRKSRILKIYGLRLNIDEVEKRLISLGFPAVCFGEDDKLRILLEGESDPAEAKARVTELFSLPPRGVEVRAIAQIERSASGKLSRAALDTAWEAAET